MRPRPFVLAAMSTVVFVSCGVPTDDGVETADPDGVPFGLLEPDRVPVAAPPPGQGAVVDVFLFDADAEHLVPVTRRVESTDLGAVVGELESGPSDLEAALGLQSALSDVDVVVGVEVEGTIATVDLGEAFTELSGTEQRVALAQLVYSLTDRSGVERLSITIDGEPVEVPRGDGTLTGDAVERVDYESLAPP